MGLPFLFRAENMAEDTVQVEKNEDTSTGEDTRTTSESVAKRLYAEAMRCQNDKKDNRIPDWATNADRRRGKESSDNDISRDRFANDWAITKNKTAQTFSQIPHVICTGQGEYKPAAQVYEERLNFRLRKASIGSTMNEVCVDTVSTAGFGAVIMEYEVLTETVQRPKPSMGVFHDIALKMGLVKQEMETIAVPTDRRFSATRISPEDFIWYLDFRRSNFNFSPFLGRRLELTTEEAVNKLGLSDEQLEECRTKGEGKLPNEKIVEPARSEPDRQDTDRVYGIELFYWRYLYHRKEKYFDAIQRIVYVDGIEKPVIDEPWKGQRFDPETKTYIGSCLFPIQVLTFNYLSDEAIPPSETSVARPLTDGMEKTFRQFDEHREHSKPWRWINTNRIDADIVYLMMQGNMLTDIPVNGRGDDAIGTGERASYPQEDFAFHSAYQNAISQVTGMGANQAGGIQTGSKSATEAGIIQSGYSTRLAQERALCVQFFLNCAHVMGGLMCLYDDFELPPMADEKRERLQFWDRTKIHHEMAFTVRGDATVLLDAHQRIAYIRDFLDKNGRSEYVDPFQALEEWAALATLPVGTVRRPQPKGPEAPNISYRYSGDDMLNPMVAGMLAKFELLPNDVEMEAGLKAIKSAVEWTQSNVVASKAPPSLEKDMGVSIETGARRESSAMQDDRPDWTTLPRVGQHRDGDGAV